MPLGPTLGPAFGTINALWLIPVSEYQSSVHLRKISNGGGEIMGLQF